jgi:hypothetical protein
MAFRALDTVDRGLKYIQDSCLRAPTHDTPFRAPPTPYLSMLVHPLAIARAAADGRR